MQRHTSTPSLSCKWTGLSILAVALGLSAARAGEQENTRELVRLVGVDDWESWKTAPSLYASVPAESALYPTAAQAMAIIHLQQGQFSEAWKLLSALSNRLQTTPISYRLGYEKLMLWLWLEAESASNAEAQFKRLVTITMNKELPNGDRRDVCYFLGGVIAMLQSSGDAACIPATIVEKGQASLEGLEEKLSVEQFRKGMEAARQWDRDLRTNLSKLKGNTTEEVQASVAALQQDLDALRGEQTQVAEKVKEDRRSLNSIASELKKLEQNQRKLMLAWNTPTPGKPNEPKEPEQPRKPKEEYRTVTKTDSKTGKRTEVQEETEASKRASNAYDRAIRNYPARLQQYRIEVQSYPTRLAQWTQLDTKRRTDLKASKEQVDKDYAENDKELKEANATLELELAKSKKVSAKLNAIDRNYTMARVELTRRKSTAVKPKAVARPSNFRLLDLDAEVYRLEKCLREMPRS